MNMRNLLLVLALGAPACVVSGRGTMAVETTPAVVYSEPPAPQVEVEYSQHRPGYVWVRGRWNWVNGQWAWQSGHWERERAGYYWAEGSWQNRGGSWVWVDGTWQVG